MFPVTKTLTSRFKVFIWPKIGKRWEIIWNEWNWDVWLNNTAVLLLEGLTDTSAQLLGVRFHFSSAAGNMQHNLLRHRLNVEKGKWFWKQIGSTVNFSQLKIERQRSWQKPLSNKTSLRFHFHSKPQYCLFPFLQCPFYLPLWNGNNKQLNT